MNAFQILGLKAVSVVCLPVCVLQYGVALAAWPIAQTWLSADTAKLEQRRRRVAEFTRNRESFRKFGPIRTDDPMFVTQKRLAFIDNGPLVPAIEWVGIFLDCFISTTSLSWNDWWAEMLPTIHTKERLGNVVWFAFLAVIVAVSLATAILYPAIYLAVHVGAYRPTWSPYWPPFFGSWGREIAFLWRGIVHFVETGDVVSL